MRAILALAMGIFVSNTAQAYEYGLAWLIENMDSVKVVGSERLGLKAQASVKEVLEEIAEIEQANLFHIIDVDRCTRNRTGDGARCDLKFADRYLIQYNLKELEGERYQVVSPARLRVKN